MQKLDFKKELKELYNPSSKQVSIVDVPEMKFIMIDGKGSPNSEDFQKAIQALYGVTFTIKMMPKKGNTPDGYFEFVVPPLDGLWWTDENEFDLSKREEWQWRIMIMQPSFVTKELVDKTISNLMKKEDNPLLSELIFANFHEGLSVQIMHIGPYSDEPKTIAMMDKFIKENNLTKNGLHHEIYLSDPRRTAPEKMKTILRQPVKNA